MLPPIICVTPKNRKTGEKLPVRSTRAPKRIGKFCYIVRLKLLIDNTIVQVRLTEQNIFFRGKMFSSNLIKYISMEGVCVGWNTMPSLILLQANHILALEQRSFTSKSIKETDI